MFEDRYWEYTYWCYRILHYSRLLLPLYWHVVFSVSTYERLVDIWQHWRFIQCVSSFESGIHLRRGGVQVVLATIHQVRHRGVFIVNIWSNIACSTTFALSYGLSFAAITSLIVYTYIHHRKAIWAQYQNSTNEKPDIHMKLMVFLSPASSSRSRSCFH